MWAGGWGGGGLFSTNSGLNVDDEANANCENDLISLPAHSLFFVRSEHLLKYTASTWRSSGYAMLGVTSREVGVIIGFVWSQTCLSMYYPMVLKYKGSSVIKSEMKLITVMKKSRKNKIIGSINIHIIKVAS